MDTILSSLNHTVPNTTTMHPTTLPSLPHTPLITRPINNPISQRKLLNASHSLQQRIQQTPYLLPLPSPHQRKPKDSIHWQNHSGRVITHTILTTVYLYIPPIHTHPIWNTTYHIVHCPTTQSTDLMTTTSLGQYTPTNSNIIRTINRRTPSDIQRYVTVHLNPSHTGIILHHR